MVKKKTQPHNIDLHFVLFLSNILVLETSRILIRDHRDFMQQLIEADAESHIATLCGFQGKLLWWEGRIRGSRKLSDTMGTRPPKSIKVGLWGFAEVRDPLVFWPRFPAYMYGWELEVLGITNNERQGYSLILFVYYWHPFPLTELFHPALIWWYMLRNIVAYYAAINWFPWEVYTFLKETRGWMDLGKRGGSSRKD